MLHFLLSEGKGEISPTLPRLHSCNTRLPITVHLEQLLLRLEGGMYVNYKTVTATNSYLPKKKRIGECLV
jgi:hypothetical protein